MAKKQVPHIPLMFCEIIWLTPSLFIHNEIVKIIRFIFM